MKRIKYYIIIALTVFLCACENFMDVHKDFIEEGETMYAPKVEALTVLAGKNRVKMKCRFYNAVFVKTVHVYWEKDSLVLPVTLKEGLDSVEFFIDKLEENAYTFIVQARDERNVWSLKTSGYGSTYGDVFQSYLPARNFKSKELEGSDGIITWISADEKLYCTEVKYTTTGDVDTLLRTIDSETTMCPRINPEIGFSYRSLYLPTPTAVDTFYTEWSNQIPIYRELEKTGWTIAATSEELTGEGLVNGKAGCILDNDESTYWHSRWDGGDDPLPHILTVDMQKEIYISQIKLARRKGNGSVKLVSFEGSVDGKVWTSLGDFSFININGPQIYPVKEGVARYLRIIIPDKSPQTSRVAALAELYVIGGAN